MEPKYRFMNYELQKDYMKMFYDEMISSECPNHTSLFGIAFFCDSNAVQQWSPD